VLFIDRVEDSEHLQHISILIIKLTLLRDLLRLNCFLGLRGLSPRTNYTDRETASLSTKLVPTFADVGCRVVSATDPYGRILDRSLEIPGK
jgi:hypothetical protein